MAERRGLELDRALKSLEGVGDEEEELGNTNSKGHDGVARVGELLLLPPQPNARMRILCN